MVFNVEVALNNRPLSYVDDDVELPVLTPVTMMYSQSNLLPEEDADAVENVELRKRARFMFDSARTFCGHAGPRNT